MLVALSGRVPGFGEQHEELMGPIDQVVRVGAPPVRSDEREHAALQRDRELYSRVTAFAARGRVAGPVL